MNIHSMNRVGVGGRAGRMLRFGSLFAMLSAAGCLGGPEGGVAGDDETVSVQRALDDGPMCPPSCPVPGRGRAFGPNCLCLPSVMPTFGLQNLSIKPGTQAMQSTTAFGGDALRAIDGNIDGDWTHNSVTHTDNVGPVPVGPPGSTTTQQHWALWFPAIRAVRHMTIYNRTDCCAERLGSITVWGVNPGGSGWMNLGGANMNSNPVIEIDLLDVNTQTFWIQKNDSDYLSLAEVQVWGVVL